MVPEFQPRVPGHLSPLYQTPGSPIGLHLKPAKFSRCQAATKCQVVPEWLKLARNDSHLSMRKRPHLKEQIYGFGYKVAPTCSQVTLLDRWQKSSDSHRDLWMLTRVMWAVTVFISTVSVCVQYQQAQGWWGPARCLRSLQQLRAEADTHPRLHIGCPPPPNTSTTFTLLSYTFSNWYPLSFRYLLESNKQLDYCPKLEPEF